MFLRLLFKLLNQPEKSPDLIKYKSSDILREDNCSSRSMDEKKKRSAVNIDSRLGQPKEGYWVKEAT